MKNVAFVPLYKEFLKDRMFLSDNPGQVGDDLFKPIRMLCSELGKANVNVHTYDMLPLGEFDAFVFCEMPQEDSRVLAFAREVRKPMVLWIAENHFIATENMRYERYRDFNRVLTYDDSIVEQMGATRISYACPLDVRHSPVPFADRGLASMICSRHESDDVNLQYRERLKTIRYYEKAHPEDLVLFGGGWDRPSLRWSEYRMVHKLARKSRLVRKLLSKKPHPLWRGLVERKRDVLGQYRFNYCYENTDAIPGYITEKILDALVNETVPIYRGHRSVTKYIPKACFIDRKDFASDGELYSYIKDMGEQRWRNYIDAASEFLASPRAYEFSYEKMVGVLFESISSALGADRGNNRRDRKMEVPK